MTVPLPSLPLPGLETLELFLLVLARTSAWIVATPLFGKGFAGVGRLGAALAVALFLTPLLGADRVPDDLPGYLTAVVGQVAVGLGLGVLTGLVFAAVDVAGGLADYASGFSYGSLLDPVTGAQSAAFARLTSATFLALLFATDGYQTILAGFVRSLSALPPGALPTLSARTPELLGSALDDVFVSALEIGAPLLGVLFLTEVALGLVSRFVPQANAIAVGLPVKALVALTAAGAMLTLLPARLDQIVGPALELGERVLR